MRADFSRYLGAGEIPTVNMVWTAVLAETLSRAGVRRIVLSPGSRSTPLALAAARCPGLEVTPVLDERSAAFIALGMARESGRPVGLVCTSGSAAAHYLPAVIEAFYSRAPLLLMTADRPPELQDCGSGQTIDQVGIYGRFVIWSANPGLPEADTGSLRTIRQTAVRAVRESLGPRPGPVHLNLPFRDPLAPFPLGDGRGELDTPVDLGALVDGVEPVSQRRFETRIEGVRRLRERSARGWILLGAPYFLDEQRGLQGVGILSRILGYPVLADVVSSARGRANVLDGLITRYDQMIRKGIGPEWVPEVVIQVGGLPTSKPLREWLKGIRDRCDYFQVDDGSGDLDPNRMDGGRLEIDLESLADLGMPGEGRSDFVEAWRTAEASVEFDSGGAEGSTGWSAEAVCGLLAHTVPEESVLFFASSLAVRHAENGFPAVSRNLTLTANRGANGIDGNVSTAIGYAIAGRTVFCLCGDLALLHDLNAFLSVSEITGSLTVLVLENDGGRIFDRLPVAAVADVYDRLFRTPQAVTIESVVRGLGVDYAAVRRLEDLRAQIGNSNQALCRVIGLREL